MKILVIDNYDSFTYNLVQLVGQFNADITVRRNDRITLAEIKKLNPDKIIISPGPGTPEDTGISIDVIRQIGEEVPILGVCLGHQAIGYCFNATVTNAPYLMHGKQSAIRHDGKGIYRGIEQNFIAGRYHSLVIEKETIPDTLEVTAETDDGIIMGIRHKKFPIEGIQYHPESVLTKVGNQLLNNWLAL
jgi:anthranilate synthase/aminodeoxychorismate synthase-like glutamine amidotransferase